MSWSFNPFKQMHVITLTGTTFRWECENCGKQSPTYWATTTLQDMRRHWLSHLDKGHDLRESNKPEWMK